MSINDDLQKSQIDSGYIELFQIDLTAFGYGKIYLTNQLPASGQQYIYFGGNQYLPFPITASGYETKADGSQPRPVLKVSVVDPYVQSLVISFGDLVGAKVTRLRTLEKYLDTGATPDASQILAPDVHYIEQKMSHTNTAIEFQLCSPLEKMNIKIPRRQITRNGDPRYGSFPGAGRQRLR